MAAGSWVFTTNARNKLFTGGFDLIPASGGLLGFSKILHVPCDVRQK